MEKRDARLFQHNTVTSQSWNIVELESHRQIRQRIQELIELSQNSTLTTGEIRNLLLQNIATSGKRFATQLVRSLNRDDFQERQAIVWLLTILNDPETIPLLQQMSTSKRLPRLVRLSGSLALAGLGATIQTPSQPSETHEILPHYAIS